MWLEIALSSGVISAVCGSILAINKIFPTETKRFLSIVRAEAMARIPIKPKRPTVELALHAGVEVDIKWWDEEFAKLERAIPDKNWYQLMESKAKAMSMSTTAELDGAITLERLRAWQYLGIKQVTSGSTTFYVDNMLNSQFGLDDAEAEEKLKMQLLAFERANYGNDCEFCEYEEVHTYASPRARRYKTNECWTCAEVKMGIGI